MALLKCPDCGREMSEAAPSCPGCGRPSQDGAVQPGGTAKKRKLLSTPTRILLAIILGIIVFVVMYRAFSPGGSGGSFVRQALRGPEVIYNEEIAVPAGGAQMRGFTLPSARPILVEVEAVSNADKGFSVYLMDATEWEKFKSGEFRHYPAFKGLKVTQFRKTGTVPEGKYGVVVHNSENLFHTMKVQVRIVADPAE